MIANLQELSIAVVADHYWENEFGRAGAFTGRTTLAGRRTGSLGLIDPFSVHGREMQIHGCGLKLTADIGIDDISSSIERKDKGLELEFHFSTIFRTLDGAKLAMRLSPGAGPPSDPPELCDRARAFLTEYKSERGLQSDTCDATPIDHTRYFRCVRDVTRADLPRRDLLLPLSRAMADAPAAAESSGIPAQFTYLGQFIAHDLTHTAFDGNFGNPKNYRSQALDLSSVFGAVRPISPHLPTFLN